LSESVGTAFASVVTAIVLPFSSLSFLLGSHDYWVRWCLLFCFFGFPWVVLLEFCFVISSNPSRVTDDPTSPYSGCPSSDPAVFCIIRVHKNRLGTRSLWQELSFQPPRNTAQMSELWPKWKGAFLGSLGGLTLTGTDFS